jgi:DNA-binding transcriptional ArsR family regulator
MSTRLLEAEAVRDFVAIAKALSDPNRVRILLALRHGELCVCQLVELLGIASSTVSRHMSILDRAYLVVGRREGRWAYYRRSGVGASDAVGATLDWLDATVGNSPTADEDSRRLEEIMRVSPEELCRSRDG